jgi:DNA sulfur modification protein DndD
LRAFHEAVVTRHIGRIEKLVLESYQQLLRKALLVTRLSIDPKSYALDLYGRGGDALSPERLSAGERQLLAIALLWGLAKASGRPIPTAIDTPLGRLDTSHRMHLVERYFPLASHQVLLLSTDEEIAGPYLERLKPWIGRCYELSYDDASGRTTIAPGYFEERKAA